MKTHHQYPTPPARRHAVGPPRTILGYDGPDTVNHHLHRHWPQLRIVLKEQYLLLTDDDLAAPISGLEHEFFDHLERKTGRPRQEFEHLILFHGGHPFD